MIPIKEVASRTTTHKISSEEDVLCASCDRVLVRLVVTLGKENTEHKIKVKCPFCGNESFIKKIYGHPNFCPINVKIIDVITENDLTTLETVI